MFNLLKKFHRSRLTFDLSAKVTHIGDLGNWYVSSRMVDLPILLKIDPRLTLTYVTSRSNLLPNAFRLGKN